jgi:hypothetical protein
MHTDAIGTTVRIPIEDGAAPLVVKRHGRSSLVHGRTCLPDTVQGSVTQRSDPAASRAARPPRAGIDEFSVISAPGRAPGTALLELLVRAVVRAVVMALRVAGDVVWIELVAWSLSLVVAMRVTTGYHVRFHEGNAAFGRSVHRPSGDLIWGDEHVSRVLGLIGRERI